ncbi:MAG: hypothetical protein R2707_18290 [Acidimicrobiales bacterium]
MALASLSLIVIAAIIAMTVRSSSVSVANLGTLTSTGPERALYERFFARSRRYRLAGAIVGWTLALLIATIAADLGQDDGWSLDLTLVASVALGGSVAGSIVAEVFRFRRPNATRIVSLDVRTPHDYDDAVSLERERAVAAAAIAAVALSAVLDAAAVGVVALAAIVVALRGIRRWSVTRIALRPRPALPAELAAADDDIRRMAASVGLGRPVVTLELIVVSWQYRLLTPGLTILNWATIACLVVAFVWWRRNRSFGMTETARRVGLQPSGARVVSLVLAGVGILALITITLRIAT